MLAHLHRSKTEQFLLVLTEKCAAKTDVSSSFLSSQVSCVLAVVTFCLCNQGRRSALALTSNFSQAFQNGDRILMWLHLQLGGASKTQFSRQMSFKDAQYKILLLVFGAIFHFFDSVRTKTHKIKVVCRFLFYYFVKKSHKRNLLCL